MTENKIFVGSLQDVNNNIHSTSVEVLSRVSMRGTATVRLLEDTNKNFPTSREGDVLHDFQLFSGVIAFTQWEA